MAVFDNFRNFIRQGKQAGDSTKPAAVDAAPEQPASPGVAQENGHKERKAGTYSSAAKRIIDEDNQAKSHMPSFPGLENYQLIEKMGDGAFSVVYKALDVQKQELRAIKIVDKRKLSNSQRASVLKEAAIMRQLDHPNIVKLYAFLESDERYFIVLELVYGGELFHQIVRLTYFSENLSRHVILQVANAIRYIHEEAGVVHRDIKPENLLFSPIHFVPSRTKVLRAGDDNSKEDEGEFLPGEGAGGIGTIKLADFGLSKVIWDSKTMTPCGTVGYTAPEIVKDERYSKSVDMWALGCVLYTLLCGFPPFYDESIDTLTRKVAKGQYTFLSPWWDDISDLAKDLVSRLLTVDPKKRLSIDQFLMHPWVTQDGTDAAENGEVAAHAGKYTEGDRLNPDLAKTGALKDAFDVTNAVYRMGQEELNAVPTVIEEEEDDEEALERLEKSVRDVQIQPGGDRRWRNEGSGGLFDLHLEGATLLERRRQAKGHLVA